VRDTFTRQQHVALDELHRIRIQAANAVTDRTPAIKRARAAGLSLAEIGQALGMSKQAVHYHVSTILWNEPLHRNGEPQ
jgi:DNA-binding NarL/FixJ family response regulator